MPTKWKREQNLLDTEALDGNETKMFHFVTELSELELKDCDLVKMFLYRNKDVKILSRFCYNHNVKVQSRYLLIKTKTSCL
jgi:hypothetical protein